MEAVFRLIGSIFIWGSAAIIVGGGYLIWEILKLFCKLIEKLFGMIGNEIENREENRYNNFRNVRENRRINH